MNSLVLKKPDNILSDSGIPERPFVKFAHGRSFVFSYAHLSYIFARRYRVACAQKTERLEEASEQSEADLILQARLLPKLYDTRSNY